ncbi:MAG TPA: hypothetical protein PK308_09540 [Phycisphaerales bacterium]|nr:hypothetical protein [Phycisphaerales bacterium]
MRATMSAARRRVKNALAVRPRRSWSSLIEPEVSTVQTKSAIAVRVARNT